MSRMNKRKDIQRLISPEELSDSEPQGFSMHSIGINWRTLHEWWVEWGAYFMAVIFIGVFLGLISRQFVTFDARAADVDRFTQALWNTLRGRFLFETIKNESLLASHFSPLMAVLAPLLLIWPDVRILSLAQTIGIAIGGLLLYHIVRREHRRLAPWFLLAFYLNPSVHEFASLELHRIILAVPFLSLALYGLATHKRHLMVVGLFLALLLKEDVAIIVAMIGFYLFFFEHDRLWGLALMVIGVVWFLVMLLWVIPAFDQRLLSTEQVGADYQQLSYFSSWGNSLPDIVHSIFSAPWVAIQRMFDAEGFLALWRVFLPLGLVLPLLAPGWVLIVVPTLSYMLLSDQPPMHRLEGWYLATFLPTLFAAIGVGLSKRPQQQATRLTVGLLAATLIGFWLYSVAPLGGKFVPVRYQITDHHRRAAEVVAMVPDDAVVAAQNAYTPHLAHMEELYMYPWIHTEMENVDYFLLDRYLKSYPLNEIERNDEINNLVANPDVVIEIEVDGIYLIRNGGEPLPALSVGQTAEEAIFLDRVEIAPADERGYFINSTQEPITLMPGQQVRVTLYWTALAMPAGDRTVSVRVADESGALVAQHDMMPNNGARPTSWWQPGWQIRDVYYLTVGTTAIPGHGTIDVLLYDSYSQVRIPFAGGSESVHLANIIIAP